MQQLTAKLHSLPERKIKIVQFGEGNFLRAFVDWIVQKSVDAGVYDGNIAVVQPMPQGRINDLAAQDGLYTLYLEGFEDGKTVKTHQIIDVLRQFVNPYEDFADYLALAHNPDLEVVISNTTEAGIALDPSDTDLTKCPNSFPGKLLALLLERFNHFGGDKSKGLAIVPCELIDNNGTQLRKIMLELAQLCHLDAEFVRWLAECNHFTNTLVDRIVPGYPRDSIDQIRQETGYIDNNVVKGEIFHLWVLEQNEFVQKRLPVDKCGLNVIYAPDIKPYKERKVKLLNGAHTAMVPLAYLRGFDTVREAIEDESIGGFVRELMFEEIKPTIKLPDEEMNAFANSVIDRFRNPFIRHELMSIALNSTTKFRTRLLPSFNDYVAIYGKLPRKIMLAFASLILFHKGLRGDQPIALADDPAYLARWEKAWSLGSDHAVVAEVCGWEDIWGQSFTPEFVSSVASLLSEVVK